LTNKSNGKRHKKFQTQLLVEYKKCFASNPVKKNYKSTKINTQCKKFFVVNISQKIEESIMGLSAPSRSG